MINKIIMSNASHIGRGAQGERDKERETPIRNHLGSSHCQDHPCCGSPADCSCLLTLPLCLKPDHREAPPGYHSCTSRCSSITTGPPPTADAPEDRGRIPVVLLRFTHDSIDSRLHFNSEPIGPPHNTKARTATAARPHR